MNKLRNIFLKHLFYTTNEVTCANEILCVVNIPNEWTLCCGNITIQYHHFMLILS